MSSYVSSSGRLAAQCLRSPRLWLIAVAVIVCLLVWVFLSGFGVLGMHLWLFFCLRVFHWLGTRPSAQGLQMNHCTWLFFFQTYLFLCVCVNVSVCASRWVPQNEHAIQRTFGGQWVAGVKLRESSS